MYTKNMRTQIEPDEKKMAAWRVKMAAWEARRAQEWERLEGIPQDKPFKANIHIGSSIFAPIVWEMRVILTGNKHDWPVIKPVDGTGKAIRCVLPNGQGKRQFGTNQLVGIIKQNA